MTVAPRGAFPALVTPLRTPTELDLHGLAGLVAAAVADGLDGVLVAGTNGEGTLLEPAERVALARAAVAAADGAPVLVGATGATLTAVQADVAALGATGVAAVLVLPPAVQTLAPEELLDAFRAVAAGTDVPLLAYHYPDLTGSSLTPEVVAELATIPGIVGMKDSSSDAARRSAFITAAGPGFGVLAGSPSTLRQALDDGAVGTITGIANLRGWQVAALHRAVTDGDRTRAAELQAGLTRTAEGLGRVPGSAPAVIKAALQLDGRIAERWCRAPLRSLTPATLDAVRTALLR